MGKADWGVGGGSFSVIVTLSGEPAGCLSQRATLTDL